MFNSLEAIYCHFSKPTTNKLFSDIQNSLGLKKKSITHICDTRWVCRFKNCDIIKSNYSAIVDALITEIDNDTDKDAVEARGKIYH